MSVTQSKAAHQASPITISPAAAIKTWEILEDIGDPNLKLKLVVEGGGCHGLTYDIQLAETIGSDDTIISATVPDKTPVQYISWIFDTKSLARLEGVEIDYESDPNTLDERFVLKNLRAQSKCSCGNSFSLETGDPPPCQQ